MDSGKIIGKNCIVLRDSTYYNKGQKFNIKSYRTIENDIIIIYPNTECIIGTGIYLSNVKLICYWRDLYEVQKRR